MKTTFILFLSMGMASSCLGQHTLAEFDWQKLADEGQVNGQSIEQMDGKATIKIINTNESQMRVHLLSITNPPIAKTLYGIVGELKYQAVWGDGFLEMWSFFPPLKAGMPEGQFFSRTLANAGELAKITGNSDWRTFSLPFDRTGVSNSPSRVEVNLVLPGHGTVYLHPLHLVEFDGKLSDLRLKSADAWWSDRTGGWIGGIGGGALGCLASVLAAFAARGKSRMLVILTCKVLVGVGGMLAIAGLLAVFLGQPYAVWFPLILMGILLAGIQGARLRQYVRGYEDLELRKMAAMDA